MSTVVGEIYSKILERSVTYCGFFPNEIPNEVSVIYLLHGRGGSAKSFLLQTTLAQKIQETSFVAFSVDVGNSYYTSSDALGDIETFFMKEFSCLIKSIHPFNVKNEFIVGISMGGYGALKWLEQEPSRFVGAAILSPLLKMETLINYMPTTKREILAIFPKVLPNLISASKLKKEMKTTLIHYCGCDDFMISDNKDFYKKMSYELENYQFDLWKGDHNWLLWNSQLDSVISRFNQLK